MKIKATLLLLGMTLTVFAQSQYTTKIKNQDFNVSDDVVNVLEYQYNERRHQPKSSVSTLKTVKEWEFSKGYLFQETITQKGTNTKDILIYVYLPDRSMYSISFRRFINEENTQKSISKYNLHTFKGLQFYISENANFSRKDQDIIDLTYELNGKVYGKKLSLKEGLIEQFNTTPYGSSIYKYNKKGILVDVFFPGLSGKKYTYEANGQLQSYSVYGSAFNKTKTFVYYDKDARNNWTKSVEVDITDKGVKAVRFNARTLTYKNGQTSGNSEYDINFISKCIDKALNKNESEVANSKLAPSRFKGKYYYKKSKNNTFWLYNDNNVSIANKSVHLAFINSDYYMYEPSTKKVLKLMNYNNSSVDVPHPVETVLSGQDNFIHVDQNGAVLFYCEKRLVTQTESKLISVNGKKFLITPKTSKSTYWFLYDKTKTGVFKMTKLPFNDDNAYWGKVFSKGSLKTDILIVVNGEQPKTQNFKLLPSDGSILFSIGNKYYHVPYRSSKVMDLQSLIPITKTRFDQLFSGAISSSVNTNLALSPTQQALKKCKNVQDIDACVTTLFKKKHNELKTSGKNETDIYKGLAMYIREIGKQFSAKVQCNVLMDSDIPNDKMASVTIYLTKEERAKIRAEAQKIVDDFKRKYNKN